jgi:glutamine amidotransferase
MDERVVIIPTGAANTASVVSAFRRLEAAPEIAGNAANVSDAPFVVLPGVGAFEAGMAGLRTQSMIEPLVDRIRAGRPTLAICLGLQLLFATSEESPGAPGLGVFEGGIERLRPEADDDGRPRRVPQLGWNVIEPDARCRLLEPGYAYFANSFGLPVGAAGNGLACAICDYGGPFVAAFESKGLLACQFHPELSGRWGLDLLRRWLRDQEDEAC